MRRAIVPVAAIVLTALPSLGAGILRMKDPVPNQYIVRFEERSVPAPQAVSVAHELALRHGGVVKAVYKNVMSGSP